MRTPNWLGDLVMSRAFFNVLRQQFPGARIDAIAKSGLADLLEFFPMVDQVYRFDKRQHGFPFGLRRYAKSISHSYDRFYCLPDSFSSAWMGRFLKAKTRIGYRLEGRGLLLDRALPFPIDPTMHRVEKYVQLLGPLPENAGFSTRFEPLRQSVDLPVSRAKDRRLVVLNLVSESDLRTFSEHDSLKLIENLRRRLPDAQLVLVGTERARQHARPILQKLELPASELTDASCRTNLVQLAELLRCADLLVSTDSGPAHLANAWHTPTLVFFGPGNPAETRPYETQNLVVAEMEQATDLKQLNIWLDRLIG